MYRILGTIFLFSLYVQLGFSQTIRRTSTGDEIYSGSQKCLNCASFLDSSASDQCSKKCKCKGFGTVLPSDDGLYVCSRPSPMTVSLVHGCSFNMLAVSESSIPFMSSSWDAITMVAEKGLGNFRGCKLGQDSYFFNEESWQPLFTGDRQVEDFAIRLFRGKAFLQWKGSDSYKGMLIKLGIQCENIAPSCLMFKVEGKSSVTLKPEQLAQQDTSAHLSRQRRDVNNSTNTTGAATLTTTPTPKPTPTSTVAPTTNKIVPTNGTDITKKNSESDNKVLLYLAMVCGAALVLVIIPVVGIAINNRMKQRKVKKTAATQKKSNEGDKNGDIAIIPGDRRSRSSTATVNVDDNGSQISSVKSSRRGSLDPAALSDMRRQSMTSLRIQDTRRGSTIEQQRPRSVAEMRRGSLPVNDLRPFGFSELRTPDLRDLRLQSLSNVRNIPPLTPDFRRSQSASDPRVQRLNSNALRESIMAGIAESEREQDDGLLYASMLDPRRNSMISLRSVSSTSALPDAEREDGSRSPRNISNLLDENEKQNALGENKFSPQPARKISASDIAYNSLPSRKLSMNMPDRDYEEMNNNNKSEDTDDDVFKLKSITPSHPNEPSYTKFFK